MSIQLDERVAKNPELIRQLNALRAANGLCLLGGRAPEPIFRPTPAPIRPEPVAIPVVHVEPFEKRLDRAVKNLRSRECNRVARAVEALRRIWPTPL